MKKIIWVTNTPFLYHNNLLGLTNLPKSSGSWLDAAFYNMKDQQYIQLHIITVGNVRNTLQGEYAGHLFYLLPGGNIDNYDIKSKTNIALWGELKKTINPDLVHVWGTESRFAYVAMNVFKEEKTIVYMQGVINTLYNHYYDGVPYKDRFTSVRDYVELIIGANQYLKFKKQSTLEMAMLEKATAIIVENDWCEYQCKAINPNCKVYRSKLPIKEEFYSQTWEIDKMEPHTIFTNAGGYPIKGHHVLFKALAFVKKTYPDVKLYIPGKKLVKPNLKSYFKQTSYLLYLRKLICKYQLEDNVIYVGSLSSSQMAKTISTCNVYVMPSIVENHSSSLIEALIVGAPCISSFVGGVKDLVENKKNCLLYNSIDCQTLAGLILDVFSNKALAIELSENSRIIRKRKDENFADNILECYNSLVN